MGPIEPKDAQRFGGKVEMIPFSSCHYWTGDLNRGGYGIFWLNGRKALAHRVAYRIAKGKIPEDRPHVLHSCDNPMCVNPDHLRPGTPADNAADMLRRDRQASGERHPCAKLTDAETRTVFRLIDEGESTVTIARLFGISESYVSSLRHGDVSQSHPARLRAKPTGRCDRRVSDADARSIYLRAWNGERNIDLADEYGVRPSFIADIKRGETYASVTGHRRLQSAC